MQGFPLTPFSHGAVKNTSENQLISHSLHGYPWRGVAGPLYGFTDTGGSGLPSLLRHEPVSKSCGCPLTLFFHDAVKRIGEPTYLIQRPNLPLKGSRGALAQALLTRGLTPPTFWGQREQVSDLHGRYLTSFMAPSKPYRQANLSQTASRTPLEGKLWDPYRSFTDTGVP